MHQLKYQDWQGSSGRWYCNDVSDLAGISGKWWVPARMLEMSLTDYILLLKNEYNANIGEYNELTNFLPVYWDNYNDCHKFVLFINRISRQKNFII